MAGLTRSISEMTGVGIPARIGASTSRWIGVGNSEIPKDGGEFRSRRVGAEAGPIEPNHHRGGRIAPDIPGPAAFASAPDYPAAGLRPTAAYNGRMRS